MKEKKPMSTHYALGLTKLCFWGGFVLMMLSLATGSSWIMYVLGILGCIGLFGGLIFGYCKVRCPYCGKSLMLGGRMPIIFLIIARDAETHWMRQTERATFPGKTELLL